MNQRDKGDRSRKMLEGKSLVLKDSIYVAEVPLLSGSENFEGFRRLATYERAVLIADSDNS